MKRFCILFATILMSFSCSAQVKEYKAVAVKTYPHDTEAYTQGLFFRDGVLYESTGTWGGSSFRIVDLDNGKPSRKLDFAEKYFLEGSVMLGDRLYMLTWTNNVAFVYDATTLEYKQAYSYPREGWGLTTDGKSLIASDGSNRIFFLDPDFKLEKTLNVTLDGRPVRYLNELEWIDGEIWANVYMTDMIVVINPKTGKVESRIDCSGLIPRQKRTQDMDVLNGIAVDDSTGKIYLTGKYWPKMFEIRLERQNSK